MMLHGATGRPAFLLAGIDWDLRLTTLALVGALLIGAVVVGVVARWRKRADSVTLTASDQLAEYRSLYLEGAISKEEFEQLRAVLGGELRRELAVPATKSSAIAPQAAKPEESSSSPHTDQKPTTPEPPANGVQPGA
jgi:hypothetical protein